MKITRQTCCDKAKKKSKVKNKTKMLSELKSFCVLPVRALWNESYHHKHTIFPVSDLHILREVSYYGMLKTAIRNANLWTGSPHFKCWEAIQNEPLFPFVRVILASLNGMSHPLFPLISLENLVKIGRYSEEMV